MHKHRLFAHQSIQAEVEIGPNAVPPVATIQISAIVEIQPSPATTVSPREVDIGAIDDAMRVMAPSPGLPQIRVWPGMARNAGTIRPGLAPERRNLIQKWLQSTIHLYGVCE
jgi:hypothetical protein